MTLSAPFVIIIILDYYKSSTITDILFLSLENYKVYNSLNFFSCPSTFIIKLSSPSFSINSNPHFLAKLTIANSSGLLAPYYPLYFVTVWHKARKVITSCTYWSVVQELKKW